MKLHLKKLLVLALTAVTCRLFYLIRNRPWIRMNLCKMTHMYRIINFMRIDTDLTVLKEYQSVDVEYPFSNDFSSYSTILYGEGQKTGQVSGVPVIFVPGNAGSYRQVRSLGSVLQNKTESRGLPFRFDVFAVDFNEELSGLSGLYLERQIKYLKLAATHIWSMYSPPRYGIIFVGHSMGGIVVRSLLRFHFDPAKIAFIVTLGTPHKNPPMVFDWYMKNAYNKMHDIWEERKELANLLVLSLSGGLKDHLVPEHLTLDIGIRHVSTTAVDGMELETDHLCIVWCNQLVRYISRLLIEYTRNPDFFNRHVDSIVGQIFNADGTFRQLIQVSGGGYMLTLAVNESVFIKNDEIHPKKIILLTPKNIWLFITRSRDTSIWTSSGKPIYSLSSLKRDFYTLVHSNVSMQFLLHLEPLNFFKATVLEEDPRELSSIRTKVSVNFFILPESGELALLLPLRFETPVIAIILSLEVKSCNDTSNWFGKVEFRSKDMRRLSSLRDGNELHMIGHLLYKEDTEANAFFILNQHCHYLAHLDISYLDTFIVVSNLLNLLSALFQFKRMADTSNVWIYSPIYGSHIFSCFFFNFHYNWIDWFTLLISSFIIASLSHVLQKLGDIFLRVAKNHFSKRDTVFKCFDFHEAMVAMVSLFVNYFYNGFFSMLIIIFSSLLHLVNSGKNLKTDGFSYFLSHIHLVVLHFYVILVYTPFGICSIWNIINYGLFSVREDPVRIPTYCLLFLKFMRLWINKLPYLKMHHILVIVLVYNAFIQQHTCITQLGYSFIAIIGLHWFIGLDDELKKQID
ncbi:unnamed protein product [Thelazia callipaeda]|uniref:GPI inositol-deacylase n=1 Tax=Thelazia callipaeda TaxID=103827 RepID=A0A0N5CWT4_THECL|nr:unnamed protein product [Thelazia callipaeda]